MTYGTGRALVGHIKDINIEIIIIIIIKLFGVKWLCELVQDVIHNEDVKLDWEFKLSLLTDLVMVRRFFLTIAMFT